MKLLFVHGTKLKEDIKGNLYTGGSYNKEVWKRYTSVFENVTLLARKEANIYLLEDARKKFNEFEKENINFIEVLDIMDSTSNFLEKFVNNTNDDIIEKAVLNSDYIIARVPSGISYTAIKYAEKYKKPYLVEVVGCAWDPLWNHSIKGKILAPLNYLMMKKAVLNANYVIYVTSHFLQNRYPTNGKRTNCSNVLLPEFDDEVLTKRLNKIGSSSKSKLIIGTIGAVNVRYKGHEEIIKALGRLKKEGNSNYEYQLVGGGDQSFLKSVAVKNNVENQIKFLGSLPHKEVINWLDRIDIYTQPSKTEGLPRSLIEAMSRGLPAFGAKSGGIPELIEKKYIFSNTKKNIDEIINIFKLYNKDNMIEQATYNFIESKKYRKKDIESRRKAFLIDFRESI